MILKASDEGVKAIVILPYPDGNYQDVIFFFVKRQIILRDIVRVNGAVRLLSKK